MPYKNFKAFHYYPVDIKQSYTGKTVKGFKFPANGKEYNEGSAADVENLQEMQLYFGVNEVFRVPVYGADERKTDGYTHKLTPERAVYEIEPAVKGLLLAVQTKMDLTFPTQLVKNIARLEIEKEILDLKETTGDIKKIVSK